MDKTIEEVYGIVSKPVELTRWEPRLGKFLETFESPATPQEGEPAKYSVTFSFPEFTCVCPRTSHPDFATITIKYIPNELCVEMKSLKYYLNSFRNEGHFHEEVCVLIYDDLVHVLNPLALQLVGTFNPRGGTYPVIEVGDDLGLVQN